MTGLLILIAAAVIYALICLATPHHTCSRCHGERMARNSKGRRVRCRPCRGTGIKARPGARLVHGFYQHVKGEPDRAGRMQRISRSQVEAEHGHQFAVVKPTYEKIPSTNAVKLVFTIDEGPKVKVGTCTTQPWCV